MSLPGWMTIAVFLIVIIAMTRPIGGFLYAVLNDERRLMKRLLGLVETAIYRVAGIDVGAEQRWTIRHARSGRPSAGRIMTP